MPATAALTRDADIRSPLLLWLRAQHPDDGSTGFVQEFKMPRPSARIDLAVVNGELAGFEIKSDTDTLVRLSSQIPAFSRFFDKVSVVTTKRHLNSARRCIPSWWGIVVYRGATDFYVARIAKQNAQIDIESLLYALSRRELLKLAHGSECDVLRSANKQNLVETIASTIPSKEVRDRARDIIRARLRPQVSSPPPITSGA